MARGRETFDKHKKILMLFSKFYRIFPMKIRKKLFEHIRYVKGNKGIAIRYIILKSIVKQCGDNVSIHEGCFINNVENLILGSNISIWPMTYIEAKGGITIGDDVSVAHNVTLLSTNHLFDDVDIPIKDQGIIEQSLIIESNVWIGAKATILCGNIVKSGSVIAAGAVVTHDVTGNTIVGGVPAHTLKIRGGV